MLTIYGRSGPACHGVSRRRMLEAGGAGLLGLSLGNVLSAEAAAPPGKVRARSVIFLFLFGGPSQFETFDMKPDAPTTIRGPFRPIPCKTPDLRICEHLPRLAALSDRYTVIRSMTHDFNDHSGGGHYIQTGRRWHVPIGGGFSPTPKDWPSVGSVVEYVTQRQPDGLKRELPAYAVVPNTLGRLQESGQYPRPGEHAGWLGKQYNPLTTTVDKRNLEDNPYWRDCTDEELTYQIAGQASRKEIRLDRIRDRRSLLEQFDAARTGLDGDPLVAGYERLRQRALAMVASEKTRRALDVKSEPAALRDRYGRHLFGQSTLVARRLVEAGVRFVTVHYDACDGYSWDSHVHSDDVKSHLLPTFDQACGTLIADLDDRGMLNDTLVVAIGEMGRTPKPTARWGRNHWSTLFPALLAGGGVRRGALYGRSDENGEYVAENPVTPEDLAATLYYALGIDPELEVLDAQARPVRLVEGGHPVMDLFGS